MPAQRDFDFQISILLSQSKRLLSALRDDVVGPPVAKRLKKTAPDGTVTVFADALEAQIGLVETGGTDQSGAVGDIGTLTAEQATAFTEMERLLGGARRSASLSFGGNNSILHSEFQIGIHEPQDLASELERAKKTLAAAKKYAAAIGEHGWIDDDATLLEQTIGIIGGVEDSQEAGKDKKQGITKRRNLAANKLYAMDLSLQNAARLAFPSTQVASNDAIVEARARYLVDEFPPRASAPAVTPPPPGPTPPAALPVPPAEK